MMLLFISGRPIGALAEVDAENEDGPQSASMWAVSSISAVRSVHASSTFLNYEYRLEYLVWLCIIVEQEIVDHRLIARKQQLEPSGRSR